MLRSAHIQDVKALADVRCTLAPLTVLVGPNACGKSSFLEALELLSMLDQPQDAENRTPLGRPELIFGRDPQRWRTKSATQGRLLIGVDAEQGALSLETDAASDPAVRSYVVRHGDGEELVFSTAQWPDGAHEALSKLPLLQWLRHTKRLQLDPQKLAAVAYSEEEIPTVSRDGAGLAAVLAHLASTDPDRLTTIAADLRKVVPITRRLRMPRAEVVKREHEIVSFGEQQVRRELKRTVWGNRLEVEIEGEGFIPADQLSEGTLLVLGLLTIAHGPKPPHLLLIDDLERALHPDAQRDLIVLLRRLLGERPGMQIICTSHSPYLLDSLEGHEVRVMNLDDRGHTVCRPLTAHPDWERFKDDLRAGEFWSTVSESWVKASK